MGRILVLLTFAGLAAVFVIIYNAGDPVQSAAPQNSNATADGNKRSTKDSQSEKRGKAHSPRRATEKRGNYASKPSDDQKVDAPATDSSQKPTKPGAADPLLTVNSDSAPVYSTNSKRSKVLRVLKRGEKVRPDLEVLDSTGRWQVVRGQQKDKPGFVLEEQVERPPADSSKNKNGREQPKQF